MWVSHWIYCVLCSIETGWVIFWRLSSSLTGQSAHYLVFLLHSSFFVISLRLYLFLSTSSCLFFFFFNLSQANQLQTATYYSQDRWEQDRSSHLLARKWQIIFPKIFKVHPVFFNLGPISWLLGTTNIEIGLVLSESAAAGSNKTGCRCRLYLHLNTVNVRSLLSAWIWQPVFV